MNILLVCANGASTGVLVEKMKNFCSEHEKLKTKTINVEATSFENLKSYIEANDTDVVLVAPQIRFKEDDVVEACKNYKIAVGLIDTKHYGRMDAPSVMKSAIELYKNR
ncbi:PTS sugar transporter subunit IIB [Clostridioides difficile]|uniref:PTS sugar transporter subunit IIB n=1 Tax=Clostridioides difficile TaxID=1496 RepID=UPI0009800C06|nr:PTS sugar transporter subunit IIB [Clostridioides difficile]MCV2271992.1 PTS sugar transporter subunit IIB [Clostridioides difficile]MDI3115734.1 PTS sugar transporter subunit IIB [Clostridioides difficile]MDV9709526.1 PTS sugar transporter subunit IIB [Clostridioides difficile]MDW0089847.1 PTS sugar transporter subunit IIB [Clostridioides difficile]SJO40084.1 Lichenan-specific phosphotransferase enzyme IIB component [Clostridioides difficile]